MQYRADSLGLVGHVTSLLIDLIHEQLGLQYKSSDADQIADRLAPLVIGSADDVLTFRQFMSGDR